MSGVSYGAEKGSFWNSLSRYFKECRWSSVEITFPAALTYPEMLFLNDEYPPVFEHEEKIIEGAVRQALDILENHDLECFYNEKLIPKPKGPNKDVTVKILESGFSFSPRESHVVTQIKFESPDDPEVISLFDPDFTLTTHVLKVEGAIVVTVSNKLVAKE